MPPEPTAPARPKGADLTDGPRARPDASMTLLTSMLERPLNPGYEAAAERRRAKGEQPGSWRTRTVVASLLAIGVLLGVSAAEVRGRADTRSDARSELVERITERQAEVEAATARARELQQEIDRSATAVAPDAGELQPLQVSAGLVAVEGPGLRITIDDPADAGPAGESDPRADAADAPARVESRDLQIVVNGLWASGAEAIAVNGQRLTARSAIRFAGEAILVNYRPLVPPYTITAVGDPQGMPTAFARSPAASYLTGLQQNYGIRVTTETEDTLTLPSAVVGPGRTAVVPTRDTSEKENP